MNSNIDELTITLFDRQYDANIDEEKEDELLDIVDMQIETFGWNDTFKSWEGFLFSKCEEPESVVNFANLFWWYGGQDHPIEDPYEFLGYFYYRIEFDVDKYDEGRILDSLVTSILPKAGYSEADLVLHTGYIPENDPKIIEAALKHKMLDK